MNMQMKRLLILSAFLAISGCEPATTEQAQATQAKYPMYDVEVHHDDQRAVTCWKTLDTRGGISCIPDWMLVNRPVSK